MCMYFCFCCLSVNPKTEIWLQSPEGMEVYVNGIQIHPTGMIFNIDDKVDTIAITAPNNIDVSVFQYQFAINLMRV